MTATTEPPDPEPRHLALRPRGPLAGAVVRMSWYRTPPLPGGVHRGLPSPWLTVVLSTAGPMRVVTPPGTPGPARSAHRALLGGLFREAVLLPQDGRQQGVQFDVHPLAARALFGVPAGELSGWVLGLDDLLGREVADTLERMAARAAPRDQLAVSAGLLTRRLRAGRAPAVRPEVAHAWRRIVGTGGRARIGEVAAEVGWSRRHLATWLRRETGLAPKDLARVARFERAVALARSAARPRLADVAAECGYADQAHLTAEWRALAGCTPRRWLAEELPALGKFPFLQDAG